MQSQVQVLQPAVSARTGKLRLLADGVQSQIQFRSAILGFGMQFASGKACQEQVIETDDCIILHHQGSDVLAYPVDAEGYETELEDLEAFAARVLTDGGRILIEGEHQLNCGAKIINRQELRLVGGEILHATTRHLHKPCGKIINMAPTAPVLRVVC